MYNYFAQKRSKETTIFNSPFSIFNSKAAFTLAEVLITLTVLGVIAAITVPNIIYKAQDRITIVKVKKTYSTLDTALTQLVLENGNKDLFSLEWSSPPNQYLYRRLKPYLNINKEYGDFLHLKFRRKNFSNDNYYTFSNNDYLVELKDGTYLFFIHESFHTTRNTTNVGRGGEPYIGKILVDINGDKGPNRLGYDTFQFLIGSKGLYFPDPGIVYNGGYWVPPYSTTHKEYCNKTTTSNPNAWTIYTSGSSCAYWIFRHNNMDYKRRNVSAEW